MDKQDNVAIFTQVSGIQYNCVLTMQDKVIHTVVASEYECITVCDETFGARNWIRVDKEEGEERDEIISNVQRSCYRQ